MSREKRTLEEILALFEKDNGEIMKNLFPNSSENENDVCTNCPNNRKNGGSGVCWCTIPYFNKVTF